MGQKHPRKSIAAVAGGMAMGAIGGAILAAFGNLISSSPAGVAATILCACVLGGWLGRVLGAIMGAICGVLIVAFGSVVGGTPLAVGVTIVGCVLLAGWLRWVPEREPARDNAQSGDLPQRSSATKGATPLDRNGKELVS
jgi:hypothetical protein